jgi:hypothetical protein
VSIVYTGPLRPTIEEGDTVTLTAVALDASGNPLPDVTVIWRRLALDTATVVFTVDSLTGLVTGVAQGTGNAQGDADGLRTGLVPITVHALADSIQAVPPDTVTVTFADAESPPLVAEVLYQTPTGDLLPLGGAMVRFALVSPAPGTPEASDVAIAASGQDPGTDPWTAVVTSGANGLAVVTARRVGPAPPDTAIVEAVALNSKGDVLPGVPARFVVLFSSN